MENSEWLRMNNGVYEYIHIVLAMYFNYLDLSGKFVILCNVKL